MATIEKYCPPTVYNPQGYSQGIKVTNAQTILFLAGQVAYDKDGTPKHKGDFKAQAEKVFANLRVALASVDASFEDVLKTTTYITNLENLPALREARGRYFNPARPPANTLVVAMLARPEFLLEIEAVVELEPPAVRHTR